MPIRADQEGSILTHSAPGVLRTVDGRTFAHVPSGIVTLVAGASPFVADSGITASTAMRLTDVVAAGTTGELNVALSAGAGFQINSSSDTDISQVFWEILAY